MTSIDIRSAHELYRKLISFSRYVTTNINQSCDFDKVKNKLYIDIKEMKRFCEDLDYILTSYESRRVVDFYNILVNAEEGVMFANSIEELQEAANLVKNYNENNTFLNIGINRYSTNGYKSYLEAYNGREYRVRTRHIQELIDSIEWPHSDSLKLFSPQCRHGEDESNFAQGAPIKVDTYGLEENDNYGAEEAKKVMTRVIKGTLKGSTISNDYFDILYLNPRISIMSEFKGDGFLKESNEANLLKNSMRYLKKDGLFVYIIPYSKISPEIKLFISKWVKDISFIRLNENNNLKRVMIIGKKEFNPSYSDTFIELSSYTYEILQEPDAGQYKLEPNKNSELKLFRGSILDESELNSIVNNDGLYEDFFKAVEIKDYSKDTTPLLPFNIGQIGLILSSGCLDGIVEEDENVSHVIKGMTIKEVSYTNETTVNDKGQTVIDATQTVSNKVQISAFGADGEFYTLV